MLNQRLKDNGKHQDAFSRHRARRRIFDWVVKNSMLQNRDTDTQRNTLGLAVGREQVVLDVSSSRIMMILCNNTQRCDNSVQESRIVDKRALFHADSSVREQRVR